MEPTPNQIQQIHNELHSAYDPNSLEIMLSIKLNKRLEDLTDTHQEFTTMLMEIIKKAKMEGWLLNLLDAAVADRPERQDLNDFVKKIKAELAPAVLAAREDPFSAHFLREGCRFPFIDREPIREAVRKLHNPLGERRVLLVDGNTGTGKTYIREYLNFLSKQLPSLKFCYIDLADEYLPDYKACELIRSVASSFGADTSRLPLQEAQEARWVRLLIEWLTEEAVKKNETWWIVIDGLREINIRSDMQALINRMVKVIHQKDPRLRLVLLDCGGLERLPLDALESVEPIRINPVSKLDLVEFFRNLSKLYGRASTEDALDTLAQLILDQTTSSDSGHYMEQVRNEVVHAHEKVFGSKEVPA